MPAAADIHQRAAAVKLLALDVDGVMSDGKLYFGNDGNEIKAFYTPDGVGIKMLQSAGITVAIITGRQSRIVDDRAANLGISHVIQGRDDKLTALQELCKRLGIPLSETAYMGDDLPDLGAIKAAAFGCAPANAADFVAANADWQSRAPGGGGAVREVCELILESQGRLQEALDSWL